MSNESLTMKPGNHDHLGSLYCAVTRSGHPVCAGEMTSLADGQERVMGRAHVKIERHGDEYTFVHTA